MIKIQQTGTGFLTSLQRVVLTLFALSIGKILKCKIEVLKYFANMQYIHYREIIQILVGMLVFPLKAGNL